MGKNSVERCTCRISLSVTNAFCDMIRSSVKGANFAGKIRAKTWDCASLVDERWREDDGVFGAVRRAVGALGFVANFLAPVTVVTNASYTHMHIEYDIDIDMFNLVRLKLENGVNRLLNHFIRKTKVSRLAAHAMKKMPRMRRRLIHKEMEKEISREFRREIRGRAGMFHGISNAAVSLMSVRVTSL